VPRADIGFVDKIPFCAFMNKGLTMKTGQTAHASLPPAFRMGRSTDHSS
jgi:hypothetical protein